MVLRVGLRTVDVGAHREGRVVRESFSCVVICAIYVDVVLPLSARRGKEVWRRLGATYAGQNAVQPVQRCLGHRHGLELLAGEA